METLNPYSDIGYDIQEYLEILANRNSKYTIYLVCYIEFSNGGY